MISVRANQLVAVIGLVAAHIVTGIWVTRFLFIESKLIHGWSRSYRMEGLARLVFDYGLSGAARIVGVVVGALCLAGWFWSAGSDRRTAWRSTVLCSGWVLCWMHAVIVLLAVYSASLAATLIIR